MLEDQKRPRKCGHFDGKQIMELDDFLEKLHRVLEVRTDIFVVARTDASDPDDIARRVTAFSEAGADAILVDGVKDLEVVKQLSASVPQPFTFNQIAGGKSPPCTLSDLKEHDVSLVIYSTPCLFSAQKAIDDTMRSLKGRDGLIAPAHHGGIGVKECTSVLQENHERRIEGARGAVLRKAV